MSSLGGMSGRYELKNWTRRSGCGYGSGARSTPRTTLKMAVLAPMASAIVRTTVREKDLARRRVRALMRIWRSMGPPSEQDRGHLLSSDGRRPERTEARLRVRSWDFPSRDRSQLPFRWCYNSSSTSRRVAWEVRMRLGFGEILVVLVLALLFFGPSKLPQLGASLGEAIKGFKKGVAGLDEEKQPEKLPSQNQNQNA